MGQPDPTQPDLQPNWHEPLFNPLKMTRFDLQPVWPVYKPINPTQTRPDPPDLPCLEMPIDINYVIKICCSKNLSYISFQTLDPKQSQTSLVNYKLMREK